MHGIVAVFLALLVAVTPTLDKVCRAFCTAEGAAVYCHHIAAPSADGSLSSPSCEGDAEVAVAPSGATRSLVPPAPLFVQISESANAPAVTDAHTWRQSMRPDPPPACLSPIVLRI